MIILLLIMSMVNGYRFDRCDQNEELMSLEGPLNASYNHTRWYPAVYCNSNEFAIGFRFKSEELQYLLDDTAGNGVRLICSDGEVIETASPKHWGTWSNNLLSCNQSDPVESYLDGFRTYVEDYQGTGLIITTDDTTLNCLEMTCSDLDNNTVGIFKPDNCLNFDDTRIGQWSFCEYGSYICGLTEEYGPDELLDDETGLHAVRFYCCDYESDCVDPTNSPSVSPTTAQPTSDPIEPEGAFMMNVQFVWMFMSVFVCSVL